jgi:hypothetical protein
MKSRHKTTSQLVDPINRRLDAYALAADAARIGQPALDTGSPQHSPAHWPYLLGAVGMLALTQVSEAKIVYTPANVYIHAGGTSYFKFDLNHDGIDDMGFSQGCAGGTFGNGCWLLAKPGAGNGVEGVIKSSYGWVAALKAGGAIGHAKHFDQSASVIMASDHHGRFGSRNAGYWNYSQARYVGVAFQIKGKTHYGWMRFKQSSPDGATLTGYAYETIPGKSIKAGQTKGSEDFADAPEFSKPDKSAPGAFLTIPIQDATQPPSLGMLALGAEGIPLWRRKEADSSALGVPSGGS